MSEHTELPAGAEILDWKCHTPKLFAEILQNKGAAILRVPLMILLGILGEVAQRAIELNDPELSILMLRLTLFSSADPASDDYDPDAIDKLKAAIELFGEFACLNFPPKESKVEDVA